MDTNGKEALADKYGSTKRTDCTTNCVHHVSLPYQTELAKTKGRSCLPSLIICQFEQTIISKIKLFVYFFDK